MIGEVIGLMFVIGFMLFCLVGVALIVMDDERDDKWQQKKWQIIIL